MKKREKFLICFFISWIIVMGTFLILKTKNARVYVSTLQEKIAWLFKNEDGDFYNLTDEAKSFFEELIKNEEEYDKQSCKQYPNQCINGYYTPQTLEEKIAEHAMQYYITDINFHFFEVEGKVEQAFILFECAVYIVILTIFLYTIVTIEFKNKKQYFIDNLKVFLVFLICFLIVCILGIIQAYVVIIDLGFGEYYGIGLDSGEMLKSVFTNSFMYALGISCLCGVFNQIAIIIKAPNTIKNRKNKRKKKIANKK